MRARLNLNPAHWGVQALAEIGVAIALAAVLGQVRLFVMPQGGSVSLELLPIIFVAVRRGVVPAATAGLLYGLLQLGLPGAFVFHPAQAALDYPLAFMSLAVAGFVDVRGWRSLALAVTLALSARFACHFLSGLIFFAAYAPDWEVAVAVRGDLQPAVSRARGHPHHAAALAAAQGLRRGLPGRGRRAGLSDCGGQPAAGRRRAGCAPSPSSSSPASPTRTPRTSAAGPHVADLVVAADGGARVPARRRASRPDVVVGDFDSLVGDRCAAARGRPASS